jgi:hypothetical protein
MIGELSGHELYYPRSRPDMNLGSCRDTNHRFVLWNLSIRITSLSVRTVKSIGSYHISIGPYCEIYHYQFVSQFYRAVLWNPSVHITFLSGRTVKSIGSHHNSICSYRLFVVFLTVAIGNLHFDCPQNPTACKDADHHLGKAHSGPFHTPTNHWVASWNRTRTDVVGPYRIAAAHCIHLALYTINFTGSVHISSYRGRVGFELARVVLWILSVCIVNLLGCVTDFLGSYWQRSWHEPDMIRTDHRGNGSYRHKPIRTYGTGCTP